MYSRCLRSQEEGEIARTQMTQRCSVRVKLTSNCDEIIVAYHPFTAPCNPCDNAQGIVSPDCGSCFYLEEVQTNTYCCEDGFVRGHLLPACNTVRERGGSDGRSPKRKSLNSTNTRRSIQNSSQPGASNMSRRSVTPKSPNVRKKHMVIEETSQYSPNVPEVGGQPGVIVDMNLEANTTTSVVDPPNPPYVTESTSYQRRIRAVKRLTRSDAFDESCCPEPPIILNATQTYQTTKGDTSRRFSSLDQKRHAVPALAFTPASPTPQALNQTQTLSPSPAALNQTQTLPPSPAALNQTQTLSPSPAALNQTQTLPPSPEAENQTQTLSSIETSAEEAEGLNETTTSSEEAPAEASEGLNETTTSSEEAPAEVSEDLNEITTSSEEAPAEGAEGLNQTRTLSSAESPVQTSTDSEEQRDVSTDNRLICCDQKNGVVPNRPLTLCACSPQQPGAVVPALPQAQQAGQAGTFVVSGRQMPGEYSGGMEEEGWAMDATYSLTNDEPVSMEPTPDWSVTPDTFEEQVGRKQHSLMHGQMVVERPPPPHDNMLNVTREFGPRRHLVNVQMQTSSTVLTKILSEYQVGNKKRRVLMNIKLRTTMSASEDEEEDFSPRIDEIAAASSMRESMVYDDVDDMQCCPDEPSPSPPPPPQTPPPSRRIRRPARPSVSGATPRRPVRMQPRRLDYNDSNCSECNGPCRRRQYR